MYMMLVPRRDFDLFDNFLNDPFFKESERLSHPLMKTDIKETEDSYIIDVDLPGFDKKDIQIDVENGYLNINAKRDDSKDEEDNGKFIRRERYYGECSRSFYIGDNVEAEDIKANFKNGILTLEVPKVDSEKKLPDKKYVEIGE